MPDDAAADVEGTQSTGLIPEGGDLSHAAMSADVQDDGTSKCKVGDEGPSEAVAEEDATLAQGTGCAAALPAEGDLAGDNPEPGKGDEERRSSNLVQRVKQKATSRKLTVV